MVRYCARTQKRVSKPEATFRHELHLTENIVAGLWKRQTLFMSHQLELCFANHQAGARQTFLETACLAPSLPFKRREPQGKKRTSDPEARRDARSEPFLTHAQVQTHIFF